jgi:dTDP-glucose 4,6-dehydratase
MQNMMKRFIVTGAYGFIGSHFIDFLDNKVDAEIYIIDKKGYASNKNNLKKQYDTIGLIHFDFDLATSSTEIFFENYRYKQFDAIFHFAAESHVDNSITGPLVFTESNVIGTHKLLEGWRKNGAHGRFIHVSTDEVYGHLHENDNPFAENTPIAPRSPYSASKAGSDLIVKSYNDTYGLDTIITRCSNNYGPKQHYEKLIPKTITNILNGKSVPVYGTGKNVREWIHVVDHVEAIWTLYKEGISGNVYNIGSGEEMTNLDVITTICNHMNVSPESTINFVEDRKGHDFRYAIDSTKIKLSTTWHHKYEFNKSIQETIEWYRQNTPKV